MTGPFAFAAITAERCKRRLQDGFVIAHGRPGQSSGLAAAQWVWAVTDGEIIR
jgi:hypothetical protein